MGHRRWGSGCGAHRDLRLSATCQVCGSYAYEFVGPTRGDLRRLYIHVIALATDLALSDPTPHHLALLGAASQLRYADLFPTDHPAGPRLRTLGVGVTGILGAGDVDEATY